MSDLKLLVAREPLTSRLGPAVAETSKGRVTCRFLVADIPSGGCFAAPPDRAEKLIAERRAAPAVLSAPAALLAGGTLSVLTAEEAAVAAFPLAGVWHAVKERDYWTPAPGQGHGVTRSAWQARFDSESRLRRFFAENIGAVPLFILPGEYGRTAFIWRPGYILQIPTEIQHLRG